MNILLRKTALGRRACHALLAGVLLLAGTCGIASAQVCEEASWTLWAGQDKDVGIISVTNDAQNVYVTYTLTYKDSDCSGDALNAKFDTLHLWVGSNLANLPANPQGHPVPGHFPFIYDTNGATSHTFTVPIADLDIEDTTQACGTVLYVVTHAEVIYLDCNGTPIEGEEGEDTAFGGDEDGGGPRWWYYDLYTICCDDGDTPVPFCQTAFAKGTHVWTTNKKSNPDKLPSLNLTQNRWGWAINLNQSDEPVVYEIWAGAGLNDTSKGTLVGLLMVAWDGTKLDFCYHLDEGFTLQEIHVYASDESPTTLAPGQYGYTQDFNSEEVDCWCDTLYPVDVQGDGIWVIAHAVVCTE